MQPNFSPDAKYTCWSEAEGGCNELHVHPIEAAICTIVPKSMIYYSDQEKLGCLWMFNSNIPMIGPGVIEDLDLTTEEEEYLNLIFAEKREEYEEA